MGNLENATIVGNLRDIVDLSIGTVVTLKSGGPKMTVTHVSADDHVSCFWFDNNSINHHQTFPAQALQECAETEKGKT